MKKWIGFLGLLFIFPATLLGINRIAEPQVKRLECRDVPACPQQFGPSLESSSKYAIPTDSSIAYILMQDVSLAATAKKHAERTYQRFARYFGDPDSRGLVYQDSLSALPDAWRVDWRLPWRPTAANAVGAVETTNILAHELGHRLFAAEIWPERGAQGRNYGTTAPDWLDETAAILLETADDTKRRRKLFSALANADNVLLLADFFEAKHPSLTNKKIADAIDKARNKARETGSDPVTVRVTLRAPRLTWDNPAAFYAQTRAFVDFLLERTGEERVFLEIAEHLEAGGDMGSWLAESATARAAGLGPDLPALERQWQDWIAAQAA